MTRANGLKHDVRPQRLELALIAGHEKQGYCQVLRPSKWLAEQRSVGSQRVSSSCFDDNALGEVVFSRLFLQLCVDRNTPFVRCSLENSCLIFPTVFCSVPFARASVLSQNRKCVACGAACKGSRPRRCYEYDRPAYGDHQARAMHPSL